LNRRIISHTFQYISVKGTLSNLFSNIKFREVYFNETPSTDGLIRSHRDSYNFKAHPLFIEKPRALRLQIFNDGLETVNPLGSKTEFHQLEMFCFTILNLPNSLNSQLFHVHPFAVCKTKDVEDAEFRFVLGEFLKELDELESEEGMALDVNDIADFRLNGTIVSACANTKGAHEIGGFMSPSATKFCRLCLISRSDINHKWLLDDLELRTRKNFDLAVENSKKDYNTIPLTGVKRASLLNDSRYFHVAENLILDAMHAFQEGVVSFSIKLTLHNFLVNSPGFRINASLINDRIKLFKYSFSDLANKPSPKFTDEGIRKRGNYSTKQNASQNWCLIRMLPFLIGDLVPEGNEDYALLLTLRHILDIIFAPAIAIEHTVELEMYNAQYFEQFSERHPGVQGINKLHHILHYPQCMRENGPPIKYSCMRYEAFHNVAKRLAQVNFNFKNITKSVAIHLQLGKCASLISDPVFEMERKETGPLSTGLAETFIDFDRVVTDHFRRESIVNVSRWVKVQGWEYREGSIVVTKHSRFTLSGLPEFAKVDKIIIKENNDFFLCLSSLRTIRFNEHYHAFEVAIFPSRSSVIELSCLRNVSPCRC